MRAFENYLFDLDGTLIDTRKMIIACFRETFFRFGGPTDVKDDEINQLIGIPYRRQIEHFFGEVDDHLYGKIRQAHMKQQLSIFKDELSLCPGVLETVKSLYHQGKKLAIVTSRTLESAAPFLEWFGLTDYFLSIVTPDHTQLHKPHPEPLFLALNQIQGKACESLFIGDALFDIQAGQAAGMATAFTKWSPARLQGITPDFYLDDMSDLLHF